VLYECKNANEQMLTCYFNKYLILKLTVALCRTVKNENKLFILTKETKNNYYMLSGAKRSIIVSEQTK